MAYTLEISYNTGDGSAVVAQGAYWRGQTFTTVGGFDVTRIGLKQYRLGTPGDCTVSIWDTTGEVPSGGALVSKTQSGNGLTTDSNGEWIYYTFASAYTLSALHKYAIVISVPDGDASNYVANRRDTTTPTYADGRYVTSSNSGSSWTSDSGIDLMFEVYSGSDVEYTDVTATITGSGTVVATTFQQIQNVTGTIVGTGSVTGGGAGSATVTSYKPIFKKRLIAIGNDRLYYEDL